MIREPVPRISLTLLPDGNPSDMAMHGGICPGVFRALADIESGSSLLAHCKKTGLAYSKAWKLLKCAGDAFGEPLVVSNGSAAHGYVLTDAGTELLAAYRAALRRIPKDMLPSLD